ncbi:MAG: amidohydrolase family protein [Candidatus Aminicenantes bacterium]|nr:amidohydrolase family protein [Candidatus Aminicenantes bacterium]
MRNKIVLLLLCLPLFSLSCARRKPVGEGATLVFTHVTIINTTGGPSQPDMTVFMTGSRITDIYSAGSVRPPKGVRVIDAEGKYLIPGLWDMHVHWYDERFLSLFIANGVTGVRQMFGFPIHLDWRERAARGELLAPRQAIASAIVDGPGATWVNSIKVANETDARRAVQKIKSSGFDFVKVYAGLPRDAYFAIADESAKQGLIFAGHVPHSVSALEASEAGQKSIEHLSGVLEACSPIGGEITRGYIENMAGVNNRTGMDKAKLRVLRNLYERLLATYDKERAAALFASFAKNGTWQCPTLTVNRSSAFAGDAEFGNDPRLKYMPRGIRSTWQPGNDPLRASRTAEDYAVRKRRYQKEREMLAEMRRAGVRFLAGTDTGNPFCFPGFSLHDELTLMVEAGFTPMEALQAATLNAAIFLGRAESLGTVEKGKIADLVLLEANPLENIENTKRIAAVVLGGKLFEKPRLDTMLADAEKLANQKSIADVLMKTIEEQNVATAVRQYNELRTREPDAYDFRESELCGLGYRLLGVKKVKDAIEIFKLNVVGYPQSSDAYSCLGEAYVIDADKENAIANYKKSLDLDPQNKYVAEILTKLGKKGPHP